VVLRVFYGSPFLSPSQEQEERERSENPYAYHHNPRRQSRLDKKRDIDLWYIVLAVCGGCVGCICCLWWLAF
jgi:hypothetical protein